MRVILTRHGETEQNKVGICQGHLPGKLTEEGIEQAKKLALRLKDEKIDVIYSSDLARSVDTTKEISKFHADVPLHFTEKLRERNMGESEGKTKAECGIDESKSAVLFPEPKGGETREEILSRAKMLKEEIYEKHKGKTVLLVGHGGINAAMLAAIMDKTYQEIFDMAEWQNTNVTIFEIKEDKSHKIHCLNCTKHLEQNN